MESQPNLTQPEQLYSHPKHNIKVYVWIALVVASLLLAINVYLYFLWLSYLQQGFQAHQEGERRVQEIRQQRKDRFFSSQESCVPKFKVETGPELTGTEVYAGECLKQISKEQCEKVDIYRASTNNFGNSDGIYDCGWVKDVTLNWKTYRDEKYGFELKYPRDWIVNASSPYKATDKLISFEAITQDHEWIKTNGNTAPVFQIDVYTLKQYQDQKKLCSASDSSDCLRMLNILGQNSKYIFVYESPAGPGFWMTPKDFDSSKYQVGENSSKTFKLTSTTLIDTSTWRTYTNTQYGFSIKYPGNWFENSTNVDLALRPFPFTAGDDAPTFHVLTSPALSDWVFPINLKDVLQTASDPSNLCKQIKIYDQTAYDCLLPNEFYGDTERVVIFIRNATLFKIDDVLKTDVTNQILSTFKFTK